MTGTYIRVSEVILVNYEGRQWVCWSLNPHTIVTRGDSGATWCDLVRLGATWCDLVFVRLDAVLGHLNKILPAGTYVLETHVL